MLQTQTQIKIAGTTYTVPYPTQGQLIEVESMKMLLSSGTYSALAKSGHDTANKLLDLIDAVSYFHVIVPELRPLIDITNFTKMDFITAERLRKGFYKYNKFLKECEDAVLKQLTEDGE
jgi:hypothetical protein